jgi:uncharacterized membrane protein
VPAVAPRARLPPLMSAPVVTSRRVSKGRLEAFSDGVFAIAITLLVLTIPQPSLSRYRDLAHELWKTWPSLAAYTVTFAVIGIMWLNHHSVFTHFARADRGLVFWNLFLLFSVALLPYPTGIFGTAISKGQGERVAAFVYSVLMFLNACAWAGLWLYASTNRRLLRDEFPEAGRRPATIAFLSGAFLYWVPLVVALVNAIACLAVHALLAAYYAFDPLSRRAARAEEPGPT